MIFVVPRHRLVHEKDEAVPQDKYEREAQPHL